MLLYRYIAAKGVTMLSRKEVEQLLEECSTPIFDGNQDTFVERISSAGKAMDHLLELLQTHQISGDEDEYVYGELVKIRAETQIQMELFRLAKNTFTSSGMR